MKTTHRRLLADLLIERYGPVAALERERPATPAELERRRKILTGDDDEREGGTGHGSNPIRQAKPADLAHGGGLA